MKYVALKTLVYSEGGKGQYDDGGNWQGEYVKPNEVVTLDHLDPDKIKLLIKMGAVATMPDIEVVKPEIIKKSPAKDKPADQETEN